MTNNETDLRPLALENIEQADRDEEQRPQKEREAVVERELEDTRRAFLEAGGTEEEYAALRPQLRGELIGEKALETVERARRESFARVAEKF